MILGPDGHEPERAWRFLRFMVPFSEGSITDLQSRKRFTTDASGFGATRDNSSQPEAGRHTLEGQRTLGFEGIRRVTPISTPIDRIAGPSELCPISMACFIRTVGRSQRVRGIRRHITAIRYPFIIRKLPILSILAWSRVKRIRMEPPFTKYFITRKRISPR